MPKYLLLKHYRGGPEPHRPVPPMDQWAPEDVEAHVAFQHHVSELLEENGEYVDAQALAPAQTWVRYGGPDAAPVTTDGPHPETSDLIAGWWIIDVESYDRAVELAAYASSEPGPGGGSACFASSRRCRAASLRRASTSRRVATAISHARGSRGGCSGHTRSASSSASCSASSAASKSSPRRTSPASTRGTRARSAPSSSGCAGSSITPRQSSEDAPT